MPRSSSNGATLPLALHLSRAMQNPNDLIQAKAADLENRLRQFLALDQQFNRLSVEREEAIAQICTELAGCGDRNEEIVLYILLENGTPALVKVSAQWDLRDWYEGETPLKVIPLRSLVDALEGCNE